MLNHTDDIDSTWTTYQAFNIVLHKWVLALQNQGASDKFKNIVFKLWMYYLKRMNIILVDKDDKRKKVGLNISKR